MLHQVLSQLLPKQRDSPPEPSANTMASISQNHSLKDIPRNILAFHTITRLLYLIQQEQTFRASQATGTAKANQHLELKLTNALSTVAVIDHEDVAVVNNINSGMFGLLAYIQPSNDKNPYTTLPESPSYSPPFWKVLFSQNFRINDHDINTPPPQPDNPSSSVQRSWLTLNWLTMRR